MAAALYSHKGKECCGIEGPGLIHAVFGQGVGKTTRCVGLAVRASGAGLRVVWVQFMKEDGSSEVKVLESLPRVSFLCPEGKHPWLTERGPEPVHAAHAARALELAHQALEEGAQVIICDELLNALYFGVLEFEQVAGLIEACRAKCELVLSGAVAGDDLLELVDYATELKQIKHPYNRGQIARLGIEY